MGRRIRPFGQQVRTSESDRPVRTKKLHERIRSTPSDNKLARANQIDPFGQQIRTSESDRPVRTTSSNERIRLLQIASSNQIVPDRSDSHRTVNCGYILRSSQRSDGYPTVNCGYIFRSSRISDCYRTVIYGYIL